MQSEEDPSDRVDSDRRLHRLLDLLLTIDGNRECFDCLARGPTWTSWSLGLFLCFRCAGLHRGLGVDVSRVKSIGLDRWTPQQVARLVQIGNERGRAIYEARLSSKFHRPTDLNELRVFIQIKFVHRVYVAPGYRDAPMPPADLSVDQLETIFADFLKTASPAVQLETVPDNRSVNAGRAKNQQFSADLVTLAGDDLPPRKVRANPVSGLYSHYLQDSDASVSNESNMGVLIDRLLNLDSAKSVSRTFNEGGDLAENEVSEVSEETTLFLPKVDEDYLLIDL